MSYSTWRFKLQYQLMCRLYSLCLEIPLRYNPETQYSWILSSVTSYLSEQEWYSSTKDRMTSVCKFKHVKFCVRSSTFKVRRIYCPSRSSTFIIFFHQMQIMRHSLFSKLNFHLSTSSFLRRHSNSAKLNETHTILNCHAQMENTNCLSWQCVHCGFSVL